jgi:hypothetical protein
MAGYSAFFMLITGNKKVFINIILQIENFAYFRCCYHFYCTFKH